MNSVENILAILEGDENRKLEQIKEKLHIHSERNTRVLLHILETSPEKFSQKVEKEVNKLIEKLNKEYRKLNRKLNSYNSEPITQDKINELKNEVAELKQLL